MAVVDARVVIDWIAPHADPKSPAMLTLARMTHAGEELIAPELLFVECACSLAAGARRSRWSGAEGDAAYGLLVRLPVRMARDRRHLDRAWELSRRYDNHPVYDMHYVATAGAARTDLITADQTLLQRLGSQGWVQALGS